MQALPNPHTKVNVSFDQKGSPPSKFEGREGIVKCNFKFPEGTVSVSTR